MLLFGQLPISWEQEAPVPASVRTSSTSVNRVFLRHGSQKLVSKSAGRSTVTMCPDILGSCNAPKLREKSVSQRREEDKEGNRVLAQAVSGVHLGPACFQ